MTMEAGAIGFIALLAMFLAPIKAFDRIPFFAKIGIAIAVELVAEVTYRSIR